MSWPWRCREQARRSWRSKGHRSFRTRSQGDSLFNNGTCTRCHGEDATGGRRAPDLTDEQWDHGDGSLAAIQEVIFWGVRRRDFADETRPFQMNPEGGMNFTREQLQAVTAYVWSLSNGTFIPERGG